MYYDNDPTTRAPDDRLDQVLREELRWEAPPELTARLTALVPALTLVGTPTPVPRPRSWYSTLVLILTTLAVGLSLAVAWQFAAALGSELGLGELLAQIQTAPALGLQRLYEAIPASRQVVALIVAVRDQLHWLLLAIVLWLALDGWQPRLARRRVS
jgi:hypothetical protein